MLSLSTLLLALNACHISYAEVSPDEYRPPHRTGPYGGTLVIGTANHPVSLNPVLVSQGVSASIVSLLFNGLLRLTPDGKIEPDLAESWTESDDGKQYVFDLKKGVRFHDGVEVTASDVLFTYREILAMGTDSPYGINFSKKTVFVELGKYRFAAILEKANPSILFEFTRQLILPKHILARDGNDDDHFGKHPVGSGPFIFYAWNDNDQITLVANPDYFEGRPYLDKVVYKPYPTRLSVWTALMRQEVDIVKFLKFDDYEVIKDDPTFMTYAHTGLYYYAISYNLADPCLSDRNVREALAYAINRRDLIDRVENGYGVEATGPFSPQSPAFNSEVTPIPFDPKKAKTILKDAGWRDQDDDGVLDREGKPFVLRMPVDARDGKLMKLASLIRQHLQAVGIKVVLIPYNADLALDVAIIDEEYPPQAILQVLGDAPFGPSLTLDSWLRHGLQNDLPWFYSNPQMADLVERIISAGDKSEEKRVYNQLHKLLYEDQPVCFLYFPYWFHAASRRVGSSEKLLNAYMLDYVIKDLYIEK